MKTPDVTLTYPCDYEDLSIDAIVDIEHGRPFVASIRILFRDKIDVKDALSTRELNRIMERVLDRWQEEREERSTSRAEMWELVGKAGSK